MAVNLTAGAISVLSSDQWKTMIDQKPVLQATDVRSVQTQSNGGENKERYRLMLSDGMFQMQGMLATQLNDLVKFQQLQKGSIVQLTEFVCSTVRDKIIIIIVKIDVILVNCDIIGDPKQFPAKLPGNGTLPVERSVAPMQSSLNQPTTTITRPYTNGGPPIQTPKTEHDAGLHSYGNERYAAPMQPSFNQPRATVTRPNTYVEPSVRTPMNQIPPMYGAGVHSYNSSFNNNSANNSMHSVRPPMNQVPSMYGNRGPSRNETPARVTPIAALNPYQGKWTIKARVTAKSELRRYSNAKGDGKVFSFDLLDSDGGEIRVTCFNAVADQFYNQIEVGKVYYISRGNVKPAAKAFNHLKNDHEITLDQTSTVQPCYDDDNSIPPQQFHFRTIDEIEGMESNTVLDVIGVVFSITQISSIMTKNQTETQKRSLSLKDMSGRSIDLTLWGNLCNVDGQTIQSMLHSGHFPVLAVKSARVHEFNGKSIGTISSSQLCIEPDLPEARELREWFDTAGKNTPTVSLSRESVSRADKKTLSQIKDEKLGLSEKPDWITVNATIWHIKPENFSYTACPIVNGDRKCTKKVVNNGDGTWRCEKCDKTVEECDYRYILQIQLQDHTGMVWATSFNETGEEIMGIPAKDLYFLRNEEQDDEKFTEIFRNVLFSEFSFKLKVKEESYGDDQRIVKSAISKVEKINFSSHTKALFQDLEKLHKKEDLTPVAVNNALTPQIGNVGQQMVLPASHVSHFGSQYGGSGVRMNSGGNSGTSSNECYKCHQSGHWARDCPVVSNVGVPSGGGSSGASGECFKCHQSGHWARDCPGVNSVPAYGGY